MKKGITFYLNNILSYDEAKLVNYKKIGNLHGLRFSSLLASLNVEGKMDFFKNRWRFSKKAKGLIVFAIIAVMLISVFAFLPKQGSSNIVLQNTDTPTSSPSPSATANTIQSTPLPLPIIQNVKPSDPQPTPAPTPNPPGVLETSPTVNSTVWRAIANNAWQYYSTDNAVNSTTGLPSAAIEFPYFTDWDLGVYIQAILDAQNINLTSANDAYSRLDQVLTFLETRSLTNESLPYWWYQSFDGNESDTMSSTVQYNNGNVADAGNLLIALKNAELYKSSLTPRINHIVNVKTNYTLEFSTVSALSNSVNIYDYYVTSGFACFWPNQFSNVATKILNNIVTAQTVSYNGVYLPSAKLTWTPLFLSVVDLVQPDQRLLNLTKQVYLAHEAYYNANGQYRAFNEGTVNSGNFVWEWVVLPNGTTWAVLGEDGLKYNFSDAPVIYCDTAFGFLALYNTTYAQNLCIYLENALRYNALAPSQMGYYDGVQENGTLLTSITNNENGMILGAARYSINANP